jgi:FAD/FMN-containing dehydrogenase
MSKLGSMGEQPLFELIVSRRDCLEALKWTREYVFTSLRERGFDPTKIPTISGLLPAGTGSGMTTTVPHFDQNNRELSEAIHEIWVEFLEQGMRRGYVPESTQGHESRLKARQMRPEFYNWLLTLKKTLDPNNIMNPGVYFP